MTAGNPTDDRLAAAGDDLRDRIEARPRKAPAETIGDAIKRLDQVKSTLGHLMLGQDPGELYARCEDDTDDDGNRYSVGLSISGVDSDDEINEALILLCRTIDGQLVILRTAHADAEGSHDEPGAFDTATQLARAILGEVA